MSNYPYKTLKIFEGKEYIEVSEVEELLQRTVDLGSKLDSMKEAMSLIQTSLGTVKKQTQLLTEEK